VFAIGYMAAVKLGVAVLYRVAMGAWPALGESPIYVMILGIAVSTPVQAGEEIGWRGFALPRLASRFGLPGASLVLGIFWGCWHLPFFFIPGSDNAGQSFPLYVLAVTALSVTMAWLYWRTHGSLGITMLMHAAINNSAGIVQPQVSATMNPLVRMPSLTAWLTALLLWVGAAYGLVKMRGASLDRA
jgi:membrane protease YdiL (CAAX protease family)